MRRVSLSLIVILIATLIPLTALAKGVPVKIVISGAGIDGEMTLSDKGRLVAFTALNSPTLLIPKMPNVDMNAGVRIDRYMVESALWDTHTYYPDPEGGLGYLFCNGSQQLGSSPISQEKWFRATPEVDAIMQEVIAQSAAAKPPTPALPTVSPMLIGGLGAIGALLLLFAAVIELRKRRKAAEA